MIQEDQEEEKKKREVTFPTPATRNPPDFAKAKEFTNPTCTAQKY